MIPIIKRTPLALVDTGMFLEDEKLLSFMNQCSLQTQTFFFFRNLNIISRYKLKATFSTSRSLLSSCLYSLGDMLTIQSLVTKLLMTQSLFGLIQYPPPSDSSSMYLPQWIPRLYLTHNTRSELLSILTTYTTPRQTY